MSSLIEVHACINLYLQMTNKKKTLLKTGTSCRMLRAAGSALQLIPIIGSQVDSASGVSGGSSGESVGLLSNCRQLLWIPITQRAFKRVSLDVFHHLLDLDLNFHLHRKTGQVIPCSPLPPPPLPPLPSLPPLPLRPPLPPTPPSLPSKLLSEWGC